MEQDNQSSHNRHNISTKNKSFLRPILLIVMIVVVGGISFYGGMNYQKGHQTSVAVNSSNGFPPGGNNQRQGRLSNRVIGPVTAISATSISVQNQRAGTNVSLAITNTTSITKDGNTATFSDIQVGDTVFVTENTTNTSQAASIVVNPSPNGGGFPQPGPSTSTN